MTWIEERTGRNDSYWMNRIERLIGKHSYWGSNKTYMETNLQDWVSELSEEVEEESLKRIGKNHDGNIAFALVIGYILTRWAVRIIRCKAYDPRRPLKHRKSMMDRRTIYCQQIMKSLVDESLDCKDWPKQEWDVPFAPKKNK